MTWFCDIAMGTLGVAIKICTIIVSHVCCEPEVALYNEKSS